MHKIFKDISDNILQNAQGALMHANMQAAFFDRGNEHWGNTSVLSAVTAGELVIKAIIAKQHPLLIFKNIFDLDDAGSEELSLEKVIKDSKTHDFQNLPSILWVVCNERLPDMASFHVIRKMRNAIQHFFHPDGLNDYGLNARKASLEFIYKNIDPLLKKHFDLYAIEFHEDHSIGYDYLVKTLISYELRFAIPNDFNVPEIELSELIDRATPEYQEWFKEELTKINKSYLLEN